jgi:hypothetical protein
MAAELSTDEELAVPIFGDGAWLAQILPILRVRTYTRFPLFPKAQQVVALYGDEVVVLRKKKFLPAAKPPPAAFPGLDPPAFGAQERNGGFLRK